MINYDHVLRQPSPDAVDITLRPLSLADYVGQEKIKQQLGVFIAAAKKGAKPWIMY